MDKAYPCGCRATGSGPEPLPDYCPEHGSPSSKKQLVLKSVDDAAVAFRKHFKREEADVEDHLWIDGYATALRDRAADEPGARIDTAKHALRLLVSVPAVRQVMNPSGHPHQGNCGCPWCVVQDVLAGVPTRRLTQCPYCSRPVDNQGAIFHAGDCAGLETVKLSQLEYDALRSPEPPRALPEVGGDALPTTLAQFELRAKHFLADEQAKISPDNALIGFLCDAVRLARENERLGKLGIPEPPTGDLALARTCLGNLYVAVENLGRVPSVPRDPDVLFAMREAAQFLGAPYSNAETKTERTQSLSNTAHRPRSQNVGSPAGDGVPGDPAGRSVETRACRKCGAPLPAHWSFSFCNVCRDLVGVSESEGASR